MSPWHGANCALSILLSFLCFLPALVPALDITLDEPFQSSLASLPHSPCTALFTRNGRFGCGAPSRDPLEGVLLSWAGMEKGEGPINSSTSSDATQNGPIKFVAVFPDGTMDANAVEILTGTYGGEGGDGKVKLVGILVVNATAPQGMTISDYTSPTAASPQGENTPAADLTYDPEYEWNSAGDGLSYLNLGKTPGAFVADADVASYVLSTAQEQASSLSKNFAKTASSPLVSAKMMYYMGPEDATTESCLSWKDKYDDELSPKCLPLGGNSIWAIAGTRADPSAANKNKRSVVMIASNLDGPSMFHDTTPAANAAAGNILTAIMAAKAIGSFTDDILDSFKRQIAFGFFQGEKYGYIGSRSFLSDAYFPGLDCKKEVTQDDSMAYDAGRATCMHPLRPTLGFRELGEMYGMLSVDQIAVPETADTLYVHDDGTTIAANVLKQLSFGDVQVVNEGNEDVPPSPTSSLMKMSGGTLGGAVLAGYSEAFSDPYYGTYKDSASLRDIDLDSIAAAATIAARAAVSMAYYDADDDDNDLDNAVAFAQNNVAKISSDDEVLLLMANCLFYDGKCKFLEQYESVEDENDKARVGQSLSQYEHLGTPPSFFAGVYSFMYGQPYIASKGGYYGSLLETDLKNEDWRVTAHPSVLETSILGLLNDMLGRGSKGHKNITCSSTKQCQNQSICSGSDGDYAVCAGGKICVCSRARFHPALDPAFVPLEGELPGMFEMQYNETYDDGSSPAYTEPFWSADVGISIFRTSAVVEQAALW
eukprot:CAMPEP_0113308368 /NCGR_PEP_ID=MMETSP0010_2-20120614/6830_1 /TAXON_ID=216773 ORGANISM="Corethron hystrix, Strain 308" /NCGR_SAMPLE_ID=MMETSP0010_2 /ASSEMBLY_ACC=CAM_ASM_000155 /LENGTH=765 /DNA_ID=CAMNT_0000163387 /DNA_START=334 /DNA_END=2628 /DNA_ORIENTATION=+ /assembly_acc=CAM_ASM_000155